MRKVEESVDALQQMKSRNETNAAMMVEDNEQLLNEKNGLSNNLKEIELRLKEISGKNNMLTSQYEELSIVVNTKEEEMVVLRDKSVNMDEEHHTTVDKLEITLAELKLKNEELESEVLMISNQKERLEKFKCDLEGDYETVSKELSEISILFNSTKSERDQLAAEFEVSKVKLEESVGLLQSKDLSVQQISTQLENVCDDLQIKTKAYEDLVAKRNVILHELEMAQANLEQTNEVLHVKEDELHQLNKLIVELKEELRNSTVNMERLTMDKDEINQQLEKVSGDLQGKVAIIAEKDLLISKINEEIVDLSADLQDKVTVMAGKDNLISKVKEDMAEISNDLQGKVCIIAERDNLISNMKNEMAAASTDLQDKLSIIAEKENLLSRVKEDMIDVSNNILEKDSIISEKNIFISQIQDELVQLTTQTQAKVLQKGEEVMQMRMEVNEMKENLQQTKNLLLLCEEDNEELLSQIQIRTTEVEGKCRDIQSKDSIIHEQSVCINQLKETGEKLQIDTENSKVEFNNLRSKLKDELNESQNLAQTIEMIKNEIENTREDLALKEQECNAHSQYINGRLSELTTDLATKTNEVAAIQDEKCRLLEEKTFAENMLVLSEEKFSNSENARLNLSFKRSELERFIEAKDAVIDEFKNAEILLKGEILNVKETYHNSIGEKQMQIESLQNEIKTFEGKFQLHLTSTEEMKLKFEKEISEKESKILFQELRASELESDLETVQEGLIATKTLLSEKEEILADMENQAEESDILVMDLKSENGSLMEKCKAKQEESAKELKTLQDLLNKKEGQMKALMDNNDSLQYKIVTYAGKIDNLQNKLSKECSFYDQEKSKLKATIKSLENSLKVKEDEYDVLCNEFGQEKERYEKELLEIKTSEEILRTSVDDLKNESEKIVSVLKQDCKRNISELRKEISVKDDELVSVHIVYENVVSEAKKTNEKHEMIVGEFNERLSSNEIKNEELKSVIENNDEEFMNLKLEKENFIDENERLKLQLGSKEQQFRMEMTELEEKLNDSELLIENIRKEFQVGLGMIENKVKKLEEEKCFVENDHEEKICELKEVMLENAEKLQKFEAQNESLRMENESSVVALNNAAKEKKSHVARLYQEFDDEKSVMIAAHQSSAEHLQSCLKDTEQELYTSQECYKELLSKHDQMEGKIKSLEDMIVHNQNEIHELNGHIEKYSKMVCDLENKNADLISNENVLEHDYELKLQNMVDEISNLQTHIVQKAGEYENVIVQLRSVREENICCEEAFNDQKKNLEKEIQTVLVSKNVAETECHQLKTRVSDLQKQFDEAMFSNESTVSELKYLLDEKQTEFEAKTENYISDKLKLTSEKETAVKEVELLLTVKDQEIQVLEADREANIEEVSSLTRHLNELQESLCSVETKLEGSNICHQKLEEEKTASLKQADAKLSALDEKFKSVNFELTEKSLTVKLLEEKIYELESEYEKQQNVLEEEDAKLSSLKEQLTILNCDLEDKLSSANEQIHKLKTENSTLVETCASVQIQLEQQVNEFKESKCSNENLMSTLQMELKESLSQQKLWEENVTKQIEEKDDKLLSLEGRLNVLNSDVGERISSIDQLKEKIKDLGKENSALSETCLSAQHQFSTDKFTLDAEMKSHMEQITSLQNDIEKNVQLLNHTCKEKKLLESEVKELQDSVASSSEKMNELQAANDIAELHAKHILKEKEDLYIRCDEMQRSNDLLKGQLANADVDIDDCRTTNNQLMIKNTDLETRCLNFTHKETEYQMNIERGLKNVKVLTCTLDQEISERDKIINEKNAIIEQCDYLKIVNEELSSANVAIQNKLSDVEQELEEKVEIFEARVTGLSAMNQRLRGQCSTHEEKCKLLADVEKELNLFQVEKELQMNVYEKRIMEMNLQIESSVSKLTKLDSVICTKNGEILCLQKEKENFYGTLEEREKTSTQEKENFVLQKKNLNDELDMLKTDKEEKEQSQLCLQKEIDQLQEEVSTLTICRDEVTEALLVCEEKLSKATKNYEDGAVKVREDNEMHEDELLKLNNHLKYVESVNSEMSENLKELRPSLGILKDNIDKLSKQKEILNEKKLSLSKTLEENDISLRQALQHNAELSTRSQLLIDDNNNINSELREFKKEVEDLQKKCKETNDLYQEIMAEKEQVDDHLERLLLDDKEKQEEKEKLQTDMEMLKLKLNETEKHLEDAEAEVSKHQVNEQEINILKMKVKESVVGVTTLQEKIDNLQNELSDTENRYKQEKEGFELQKKIAIEEVEALKMDVLERENLQNILKHEQEESSSYLQKELEELKEVMHDTEAKRTACEANETLLREGNLKLEVDLEENCKSLQYVETIKEELCRELKEVNKMLKIEQEKSTKLSEEKGWRDEEIENLKEELDGMKDEEKLYVDNLSEFKSKIEEMGIENEKQTLLISEVTEQKNRFQSEMKKLKICFDALTREYDKTYENFQTREAEVEELQSHLDVTSRRLHDIEDRLQNEKENNVCNKAEISNLNINLSEVNINVEKEKRKVKKLQHDIEKKNISITELERELECQKTNLLQQAVEMKESANKLSETERLFLLEKEKSESKQEKLNEIKKHLLRNRSPSANKRLNVSSELLDESVDYSSQILKLQERSAIVSLFCFVFLDLKRFQDSSLNIFPVFFLVGNDSRTVP